MFSHNYGVENLGPNPVGNLEAHITWPLKVALNSLHKPAFDEFVFDDLTQLLH